MVNPLYCGYLAEGRGRRRSRWRWWRNRHVAVSTRMVTTTSVSAAVVLLTKALQTKDMHRNIFSHPSAAVYCKKLAHEYRLKWKYEISHVC